MAKETRKPRLRRVALCALICLPLTGCSHDPDPEFASPAATFATYQRAIRNGDLDLLWSCYSTGYRQHLSGGREAFEARWHDRSPQDRQAELGREVAEEKIIDGKIAYLLFDSTTLPNPSDSPFFYLVREDQGWFLTSHLDGVFHRRLEQALEAGALDLTTR